MRKTYLAILAVAALAGAGLYYKGVPEALKAKQAAVAKPVAKEPLAPAVTVAKVAPADFRETVLVTGTLVPREEILVGPEVEGLRVLEVLADEGDRVKKGQTLARLVNETLDAQLAQNSASVAKAGAAIAQARSNIVQAEARLTEAKNALDRGRPLKQSGYLSESTLDQREQAARTAEAQVAAARDGLRVAEADKAQVEAQRREIAWRRERTEVMAPADGIVSRRNARIGASSSGASEPMFRIIAKGEIELDSEVGETRVAKVRPEQPASIEVAGVGTVQGRVRLVSPEVDKATRLGRVRVFVGDNAGLRIGAFARATIVTAEGRGLAVPASAVLYGADGATVQVVRDGRVETRRITIGLEQSGQVEARTGLAEGEHVVAKSGTFLRDGDAVRPVPTGSAKLSEVK